MTFFHRLEDGNIAGFSGETRRDLVGQEEQKEKAGACLRSARFLNCKTPSRGVHGAGTVIWMISCCQCAVFLSAEVAPYQQGSISRQDWQQQTKVSCSLLEAAGMALPFAHCSLYPAVLLCLWPHCHLPKSSSEQMFLQMCSLQISLPELV